MPQAIEPPTRTLPPTALPRVRWTVEQYENIFTVGVLSDSRYELIEGDIIERTPSRYVHSFIITCLFAQFSGLLGFALLRSRLSLWIDSLNLPEPDFVILSSPHPIPTVHGYLQASDMQIVVEVSDGTIECDLTIKAAMYARAGIPEYWVVDVAGRRLLIHGVPGNDGYTQVTEYSETDTAAPLFAPSTAFTVSQILP
jgi:Uma2 family endonuclease